jgi:hypothetical protein
VEYVSQAYDLKEEDHHNIDLRGEAYHSSNLRGEANHGSNLRGEATHDNDWRGKAIHDNDLRGEAMHDIDRERETNLKKSVTFDLQPHMLTTSRSVMDCWKGEILVNILMMQEDMALVEVDDLEYQQAAMDIQAFSAGLFILGNVDPEREERLWAITRGKPESKRERLVPELERDTQNYTVTPTEVSIWKKRCEGLEVDACADPEGHNAVMKEYWSDVLGAKWEGRKVWCNPPYNSKNLAIESILKHFHASRTREPSTQALFVLPLFQGAAWTKQLRKMPYLKLVHKYEKGFPLFHSEDGALLKTRWPVGIYWSGELKEGLKPDYCPIPTNAHPNVQATTREATRPRMIGFLQQVVKMYGKDKQVREWIRLCQGQSRGEDRKSGLRVVGKVLWRVHEGNYQVVIPDDEELKELILKEMHDIPSAGHLAREKTLERIRRRFWWPGWAKDGTQWVAECPVCQMTKGAGQAKGELHQPTPPHEAWEVINMDFVTGLPRTVREVDAILTFTDRFSKMVHLVPMDFANSTAPQVARLYFDHVWRLHGCSQKIISDRDPRFMSAFYQTVFKLMGTTLAPSTPYHPQTDGQAENTNKTMEQILRAYVDPRQTDWDLYLTPVEFAINDSRHAASQYTPFKIPTDGSLLGKLKEGS